MKKSYTAAPYVAWSVLFTVVPLFLVLFFSLSKIENGDRIFTLEHYYRFFDPSDSTYRTVLWRSIKLAFVSTAICLGIGYPVAYFVAKMSYKWRNLIILLFVLPMWMNFLLRTYAMLTLLERTGLINTWLESMGMNSFDILYTQAAVVLGMVYNYLPFMVLPIYSVIMKIDKSVVEAAQDLGANSFNSFLRVELPLSMPGIASGITMVFMPSVTTFAISKLLGGGKVMLIGDLIEQQFKTVNNWGFGSSLSVILIIVILASIGVLTRYEKENEGGGLI